MHMENGRDEGIRERQRLAETQRQWLRQGIHAGLVATQQKKFKCSIYSESGQKLNEFTVTARGCTSNQISVGSKKIYAFVWVTDYATGKFLATANTRFYRAD
jgi:hypothetical protein